MRSGASLALAGLLLAATTHLLACGSPETPDARPNVVLVVLDTLRPDHLGHCGYPRETAPFLASLARGAAHFPEAISTTTWTAPATASLLTGLYPQEHGVMTGLRYLKRAQETDVSDVKLVRLPESVPTWSERLQAAGYQTFGVASNINIGPELGFDRGFDRFARLSARELDAAREASAAADSNATRISADARAAFEQLREWRDEIVDETQPAFLYLHLNDVHRPYRERQPWYRATDSADDLVSAYNSEIGFVDFWLSRIWREFELHENTLVVVVSDHGEAFGEHGYYGHSRTLDGPVQKVAFFVRAPELDVVPGIHPAAVSLIDVYPTVLDLLELGAPVAGEAGGQSLVARLDRARSEVDDRILFGHKVVPHMEGIDFWSVQAGNWKAKRRLGRWSLYDLATDPGEQRNVAMEHPEVLDQLKAEWVRFEETTEPMAGETIAVELDHDRREELRSLGYAE